MELVLLSALLLLTIFLSFPLSILYYSKPKKNARLPPGKMGWPIIGETLELISMGRKGTPEKFFEERMKKHSSHIFKTSLFGENIAVVCGSEGHKFLFSNENKLVAFWWPESLNKIIPTSQSSIEFSSKVHRLVLGFLKPHKLQKIVGIIDGVTRQHVESHWSSKKEVAVSPLAKRYAFDVACKLLLSIEESDNVAKLEKLFDEVMSGIISLPINLPGTRFTHGIKAADLIRVELLRIIRQRKLDHHVMEKNKSIAKDDFLSYSLTATDENGEFMTELNVADVILATLLAGRDTIASGITFIMKCVTEMPEIYDKVLKEQRGVADGKHPGEMLNLNDLQKMTYSWNVAREALRLMPTLPGTFREAITDFTYGGFFIRKGWKLLWNPCTTQMSPEYFPEPEKFDPSRFDGNAQFSYAYVPFGGGPRMCPGKEYARVAILAFMYNVVTKFRWDKIIADEKITVDPMPKPVKGLPIRLHPI